MGHAVTYIGILHQTFMHVIAFVYYPDCTITKKRSLYVLQVQHGFTKLFINAKKYTVTHSEIHFIIDITVTSSVQILFS